MARQDRTYSESELTARLATLPGWALVDGWLERRYVTDGWPTTLMLVNAVGFIAEAADHHPDLTVAWSNVVVRLRTHSAKGITDKDLELAQKIGLQPSRAMRSLTARAAYAQARKESLRRNEY